MHAFSFAFVLWCIELEHSRLSLVNPSVLQLRNKIKNGAKGGMCNKFTVAERVLFTRTTVGWACELRILSRQADCVESFATDAALPSEYADNEGGADFYARCLLPHFFCVLVLF